MTAEERTTAPFLDVAAEAQGILTKQEELMRVKEVIQSKPKPSDEEQAMVAAANSGIDFSLPPEDQPNRGEIIEILDDEDDEILGEYMNEESTQGLYGETLPKIKESQEDEEMPEEVVKQDEEYWQSKQNRIANRQYQDYKLYVTAEEEDTKPDVEEDPEEDPKKLASVAHYIIVHYAEKESIKKKRKKKYKPKAGQYSLEVGLKHFWEKAETAVSKELKQCNVYDVFEPLYANNLSKEEKSKALTSLIFFREKRTW